MRGVGGAKKALTCALLAIGAMGVQGVAASPALADNCWQNVPQGLEYCNYAGESVPRYTARWFSAPGGNNLRAWHVNEVADAYGGSVLKCTGYKPEGLGYGTWLACGTGTFASGINPYPRSWLFIEQLANGPRVIYGQGRRWIPNV
jgi:hypothetical protein